MPIKPNCPHFSRFQRVSCQSASVSSGASKFAWKPSPHFQTHSVRPHFGLRHSKTWVSSRPGSVGWPFTPQSGHGRETVGRCRPPLSGRGLMISSGLGSSSVMLGSKVLLALFRNRWTADRLLVRIVGTSPPYRSPPTGVIIGTPLAIDSN